MERNMSVNVANPNALSRMCNELRTTPDKVAELALNVLVEIYAEGGSTIGSTLFGGTNFRDALGGPRNVGEV
jgi:hypothetical protein